VHLQEGDILGNEVQCPGLSLDLIPSPSIPLTPFGCRLPSYPPFRLNRPFKLSPSSYLPAPILIRTRPCSVSPSMVHLPLHLDSHPRLLCSENRFQICSVRISSCRSGLDPLFLRPSFPQSTSRPTPASVSVVFIPSYLLYSHPLTER
jgi:hypothetical protein